MAKNFNIAFKRVKEQVYSNEAQALVALAAANSSVEFTPILAPNGAVDGTTSKYNVQRKKRPTVNVVANANAGTTAAALAALDQFGKVDWESLEVKTGTLRSVGVKSTISDEFDFANENGHDNDLMYQMGEVATQRKTDLIALMETFTASGAALPAFTKGDTKIWDALADEVITLAAVSDSFKGIQAKSDFIIVIDYTVAKELAKEMGTAFYQEAPIAQTGFKSNMSINGTPVLVDPALSGRKAYVFHKDALGFKSQAVEKDVNIDLGLTSFQGVFFYDVMAVVDSARAKKIAASA